MTRPSETITAVVGSIVGAILVLLGQFTDVEVSAEAAGAIVTLVSWIAVLVTWYVAKKQREGELRAAKDGTVQDVPTG